MQEYIIRTFDNGATEMINTTEDVRRVEYHNQDVVYYFRDQVVLICGHNGGFYQSNDHRNVQGFFSEILSGLAFRKTG